MESLCSCYVCQAERDDLKIVPIGKESYKVDDSMVVCNKCGNKRCPHATNHEYPCTHSNKPGQEGSIY